MTREGGTLDHCLLAIVQKAAAGLDRRRVSRNAGVIRNPLTNVAAHRKERVSLQVSPRRFSLVPSGKTVKSTCNARRRGEDGLEMIYPLIEGRQYTIGQLRETEAVLLGNRQRDQEYSAKLRTQKGTDISWAKSRAEEAYAILLFAKHLAARPVDPSLRHRRDRQ
jgi:hypothetical protein